ncbi:XRE family transcriptional regulator [Streptomyces zinciresistens K42]|uniref:XRE family transcriptional regulator n=1 Tax=Streptomyces zinciresistens K42 TaxID=700597 RepID=G2GA09_9ACTN|nr:XRE family transcriptional regulator [Streptomyces zinciresistens K42]
MTTPTRTSPFGSLLQFHRIREGYTQQQLADFSALSVRAIRDLEHGRVERPRQDTVRLLADALRLDEQSRDHFARAARAVQADRAGAAEWAAVAARTGYEYATILLASLSPDAGDGAWESALNDMAKQSWRLLAVDQGVAFLERRLAV